MTTIGAFFRGMGFLFRGFGLWARRPRLMLLGMLPALIVGALVVGALVVLAINMTGIVDALTPFANGWDPVWSSLLRLSAATVLFVAAVVLCVLTFTGLTLAIGDPFYERIWGATERELGGEVPEKGLGFFRSLRDALVLIVLGALVALLSLVLGLLPLIGGALATVVGVVLAGRLLARELTSRSFEARGMSSADQRALLPGHRAELLGFGVATQLFFLIPFGAVAVMPAAVAGSTMLARTMLPRRTDTAQSVPNSV